MNFSNVFAKSKYYVLLTLVIYVFFNFYYEILADYMQSSTYKIQQDSVNFGGSDGASDTYKLNDTMGEIGTGDSNSDRYYLHAGYWQMNESYIAISEPSDLVMSSMGGLSGGSSEGTMSWQVTTDNSAGYTMTIASTSTPALKSATDSLDDYVPVGADPDYDFINADTASSFGFTPEGTEASSRYLDNGFSCNIGVQETPGKCWDGLSTIPKTVAQNSSANVPSGSTATVHFRAETGANHIQSSGDYNVTIVATATTL